MRTPAKVGLVLAGYVAALLVPCAFFWLRELVFPSDPSQAGGMQAFGDLMLFCAMFGFLALFPTALALFFLRGSKTFWKVFSVLCLAVAMTGPVAAVTIQRNWLLTDFLGILRVLGAPLLGLGFLISAVIVPRGCGRWALVVAALIEGTVSAYAYFCLLVLQRWLL